MGCDCSRERGGRLAVQNMQAALRLLANIESAVADGDLASANSAASDLKPLLVGRQIDELLAVRQRIAELTLGVKTIRSRNLDAIKELKSSRGGAAAYQAMQAQS